MWQVIKYKSYKTIWVILKMHNITLYFGNLLVRCLSTTHVVSLNFHHSEITPLNTECSVQLSSVGSRAYSNTDSYDVRKFKWRPKISYENGKKCSKRNAVKQNTLAWRIAPHHVTLGDCGSGVRAVGWCFNSQRSLSCTTHKIRIICHSGVKIHLKCNNLYRWT